MDTRALITLHRLHRLHMLQDLLVPLYMESAHGIYKLYSLVLVLKMSRLKIKPDSVKIRSLS